MSQNRSSAVMQQRSEPHDSLDDFPTPPWATRALCEFIAQYSPTRLGDMLCREPTANRGHMVRPLLEYFAAVEASDIFDYGAGFAQMDYLFEPKLRRTDWSIFNPPFRLAEQFIAKAIEHSDKGVAVIVRSAFLEGIGRYERLFNVTPPSHVLQFSERVVMHKGRLAPEGSTATAYSWLVWFKYRQGPTSFHWIPPCRERLERSGDYPAAEPGMVEMDGGLFGGVAA